MVSMGAKGSFWPGVDLFRAVGELMDCILSRELGAYPRLTFRGLSCWEASETLYLWFRFYT